MEADPTRVKGIANVGSETVFCYGSFPGSGLVLDPAMWATSRSLERHKNKNTDPPTGGKNDTSKRRCCEAIFTLQ